MTEEEKNTLEVFRNLDPAVLNAYYDALEKLENND